MHVRERSHGAGVPPARQADVFTPTPRNTRRAIFATNLAETSLTIEGVVYVVDALHARQRAYDPLLDLDSLLTAPITRASATQRAGRAGRVRPGHCFRLCTREAFEVRRQSRGASLTRWDLRLANEPMHWEAPKRSTRHCNQGTEFWGGCGAFCGLDRRMPCQIARWAQHMVRRRLMAEHQGIHEFLPRVEVPGSSTRCPHVATDATQPPCVQGSHHEQRTSCTALGISGLAQGP